MSKVSKLLLTVILVLSTLLGCQSQLRYEAVQSGNSWYILVEGDLPKVDRNGSTCFIFETVSEMKDAFLNGGLTQKKLKYALAVYNESRYFPIPNLSNLYVVAIPKSQAIIDEYVYVEGADYYFKEGNRLRLGPWEGLTDVGNRGMIKSWMTRFDNAKDRTYVGELTITEDAERNAKVYSYTNREGAQVTESVYIIEAEGKQVYVREKWEKNPNDSDQAVTYDYTVYGLQENGLDYSMTLTEYPTRLTVEEISAFGLVPYEG